MTSVYEDDWKRGYDLKLNQTYSAEDMKTITATAKRSYTMPKIDSAMPKTPTPAPISDVSSLKVWASPDDAFDTLTAQLKGATKSISVEIYQVTDDALCSFLESTAKGKISLK